LRTGGRVSPGPTPRPRLPPPNPPPPTPPPPPPQSQIRKVRDRETQLEVMRVPEDALDGHAFHTYTLTSPDGSVRFSFQHNVVERTIYAEGTVDAVLFLAKMRAEGASKKVYNMVGRGLGVRLGGRRRRFPVLLM
jgi:hypothetical protein